MKPIFVVCVLFLFGLCMVRAQTPTPAPETPATTPSAASDEQQLLTIEQEWCGAYLHGDADYLTRLLTDDFVITNSRAEVNDKAAELQETRDRTVHYTVFENRDMTVRVHGDAAVVTGRTRLKGTIAASGKAIEAEVQFTDVFARIDGRWRAIAAHSSRVEG